MKSLIKVLMILASVVVYKAVEDTRVAITALREQECQVAVTEVQNGRETPLNSAVTWVGKDSYIIIISTPADNAKWDAYFKKYVLPSLSPIIPK